MLNGDRILVTNDDVLPMVEVDENYGHNLLSDFQWFIKLTFVWDDLKSLRADLERCSSATSFYLRIKLVQAAIELQVRVKKTRRFHFHVFVSRLWKRLIISVDYITVISVIKMGMLPSCWSTMCPRERHVRVCHRRISNGSVSLDSSTRWKTSILLFNNWSINYP